MEFPREKATQAADLPHPYQKPITDRTSAANGMPPCATCDESVENEKHVAWSEQATDRVEKAHQAHADAAVPRETGS